MNSTKILTSSELDLKKNLVKCECACNACVHLRMYMHAWRGVHKYCHTVLYHLYCMNHRMKFAHVWRSWKPTLFINFISNCTCICCVLFMTACVWMEYHLDKCMCMSSSPTNYHPCSCIKHYGMVMQQHTSYTACKMTALRYLRVSVGWGTLV